jgi:hypothetical protein
MTRPVEDAAAGAARRTLFGRLAGALALGVAGLVAAPARAETTPDGPDWPGKLSGRHRQVVDAYAINQGHPLTYAHTFLATSLPAGSATGIVVLRGEAVVMAVDDAIWDKYKIGEHAKIVDPGTKAIAVKNPFLRPMPGALPSDDMAIDRLLAAGTIFGACNVALHGASKSHAALTGVSAEAAYAEAAYKDWSANLIPGIALLPSGVWGLNRAQEAGCTYCAGG